jgi:hypothetical protein
MQVLRLLAQAMAMGSRFGEVAGRRVVLYCDVRRQTGLGNLRPVGMDLKRAIASSLQQTSQPEPSRIKAERDRAERVRGPGRDC